MAATRAMAEAQGVSLRLEADAATGALNLSQPLFRQLVIVLLSKLMSLTARDGRIAIAWRHVKSTPTLIFEIAGADAGWVAAQDDLPRDEVVAELMKRLNAEMDTAVDAAGAKLALRFVQARHSVLIIDDNPDAIRLFQRYLANQPYQLLAASDESEALRIAKETPLQCIILDIMLPRQDGWQILQTCKSHPATERIPVLICSVLDMRELALSLGADGYMQKPPARDEFLALLRDTAD